MRYHKVILTATVLSFWAAGQVLGQGCSDAGVCSVGIMSGEAFSKEDPKKSVVGARYALGQGDDSTVINTLSLEGQYAFTPKTFVQLNVPFLMTDGNLGKTSGIGDLLLTVNQLLKQSGKHQFEGFAGIRIATGTADQDEGGQPLPMVYQTSLGTTDLMVGFKWFFSGWSASLAYQQPVVQDNQNQFLYSAWPGNPNVSEYAESRELERAGDIVARVDKAIPIKDFTLTLGLLPIYHIQNDTYKNDADQRVSIDGSQGLTLNVTGGLDYQVTDALSANVFLGAPIVTRDVQPDGLARNFVGGLGVFYNF